MFGRKPLPLPAPTNDDGRFEQFAADIRGQVQELNQAVMALTELVRDYVVSFTNARRLEHDKFGEVIAKIDENLVKIGEAMEPNVWEHSKNGRVS